MSAQGLTYDAGALIAADRGERLVWALHHDALRDGVTPVVPAGALAQAWRGGPQALLSRLLVGCGVEPLDEPAARRAGTASARSGSPDIVDASVAISAAMRGDRVVTSEPADLRSAARALGLDLAVQPI